MIFYDEIYYEITLKGLKCELKKFVDFLYAGALDDFFEVSEENVIYGDNYNDVADSMITDITILNEDGIAIDEFNVEEFLDLFCQAAIKLEVYGFFYDADEIEYNFTSESGSGYFKNSRSISKFNDELDDIRDEEENFDDV